MRCDNCGSEVEDKDIYCGNCGHRIERDYEVVNNTQEDDFIDVTPDETFKETASSSDNMNTNSNNNANASANKNSGSNNGWQCNSSNNGAGYNQNYARNDHPKYKAKLTNSSAIISMVCGILSVLGVISLVTGIIGLCMAKKSQQLIDTGEYSGEEYTKAGKICSIIGVIFGVFQLLIFVLSIAIPVLVSIFAVSTQG